MSFFEATCPTEQRTPADFGQTFGEHLVHADGRGHNTRMGIWQAEHFEQRLNGAVFAAAPVKIVEHGIGFGRRDFLDEFLHIARDVDGFDRVAGLDQRGFDMLALHQGDFAFRAPPADQKGYCFFRHCLLSSSFRRTPESIQSIP